MRSSLRPLVLVVTSVAACGAPENVDPADVSVSADLFVDAREGLPDAGVAAPDLPTLADRASPLDTPPAAIDARAGAPDVPSDRGAFADLDARSDARDAALDAPRDAALDASGDASGEGDGGLSAPFATTLVPARSVWRYLDTGVDPAPTWVAPGFPDTLWRTGPAQLGYGDGDEATVLRYGFDPAHKFITTYFRKTFAVGDPRGFRRLVLRLLRDDGAAVYLNGREVWRSNLRADAPIGRRDLATATVSPPEESTFQEVLLSPTALVAGENTLAVEVHQAAPDSSDLSFDLELTGYAAELWTDTADPVFVGAGDIATSASYDEATARLLDAIRGPVFILGDNAYDTGSDEEYRRWFGPTWGRHLARIHPAVGNHEYLTPRAAGYYRYFGAAAGDPTRGYYSYELGAWHVVVLNSNCAEVGGCGATSPQGRWLAADLAAHPTRCALAYWHHPRFSSGVHGSDTALGSFFQQLYDARVELVLNGHEHNYERFAPQTPAGALDRAAGLREFVVGTGGVGLRYFPTLVANSEVRNVDTHGVLRLALHPTGYEWRFVPVEGDRFTDSGSEPCH